MREFRTAMLASAAVLTPFVNATAAGAQDVTHQPGSVVPAVPGNTDATAAGSQSPVTTTVPPSPADTGSPAAADSDNKLADIIVTAQRRSENLQRVPIAITVASAAKLEESGVESISTAQAISPSVTFRTGSLASTTANVVIRGLGTTGDSRSFEGSVGIFVDGVYRTRAASALQAFLDVDNLQILRGPQGTLFGKNTTAGAILVTSVAPDTTRTAEAFSVSYGNYDTVVARASVNAPLGDGLAFRIAGVVTHNDGFYHDATTGRSLNGDTTEGVKAQLLWEPSATSSIRLIGDYLHSQGDCCFGSVSYVRGPVSPLIDALTIADGLRLASPDLSKFEASRNSDGHQRIEDYGGTLIAELHEGQTVIRSISAARHYGIVQRDNDPDFSGADLIRDDETFSSRFLSEELTVNAPVTPLHAKLVVGGFVSDERLAMTRDLTWGNEAQAYWNVVLGAAGLPPGFAYAAPGLWATEDMSGTARSYAAFAHADFALSDRIDLITGIRYSIERKTGQFHNPFYRPQPNDVLRIINLQPGPAYAARTTDRAPSWTAGLTYRPADRVMLYATYNRGFKAGGVNMDANAAGDRTNNPVETPGAKPLNPVYAPEKVDAYEVGAKLDYLNGRARFNISAFHYDIADVQVAQFIGLRFTVLNARAAKDTGLEVENAFRLNRSLNLSLDGTWLPTAKFDDDPTIDPVLSGSRFRYAPKLKGNATIDLDTPLSGSLNLTGRLQYQYTSAALINTASFSRQSAYSLVNANLGVRLPGANASIEAFALNLTNKTAASFSFNTTLQTGSETAYLAPPRTFGGRLAIRF